MKPFWLLTFISCVLQLVDDVLDFTAGASHLGKPSAADLKLGLATGPVLFACQQVRPVQPFFFSFFPFLKSPLSLRHN